MERHSISLIGFSVFFGVLVGISILLSAFYANGMFNEDGPATETVTTGMEILENYTCQKAETKQIVIGGVEDNFDLAGVETSNPSETVIRYVQGYNADRSKSDIVKTYDEPTQDKLFSDRFAIPKRTYSGIVIVRLEELSGIKNDGITIGYNSNPKTPYIDYGYTNRISNLTSATEWEHHGVLFFASLGDLKIVKPSDQERTLLDVIRAQKPSDGDFFVDIADDTIVDFVGFALCLEPEEDYGSVFSPHELAVPGKTLDLGPGIVTLFNARIDGIVCNYGGCLSCEAERPIACIDDTNMPLPKDFNPERSHLWSGGTFDFTRAVKGSNFSTEDEVDQFCADEFGADWRALSLHDGAWNGGVSGNGAFPSGYENVWITVKDSDHHNCWKSRLDYEALNDR